MTLVLTVFSSSFSLFEGQRSNDISQQLAWPLVKAQAGNLSINWPVIEV
jgi:hypothetical protein